MRLDCPSLVIQFMPLANMLDANSYSSTKPLVRNRLHQLLDSKFSRLALRYLTAYNGCIAWIKSLSYKFEALKSILILGRQEITCGLPKACMLHQNISLDITLSIKNYEWSLRKTLPRSIKSSSTQSCLSQIQCKQQRIDQCSAKQSERFRL